MVYKETKDMTATRIRAVRWPPKCSGVCEKRGRELRPSIKKANDCAEFKVVCR